jgi:hypothetical protein
MNTIESLTRGPAPAPTEPPGDAPLHAPEAPTFGEIVDEVAPVIDIVAVAGPPVAFVAGPWLLLTLMLSAPFAVLVALVAVWVLAAVLLATLAAILAAPYLLVRRLHRRDRTPRASAPSRASLAPIGPRRAVA